MQFAYLRDPLFLVCLSVYAVNRVLEDFNLSCTFARSYLNDIVCIPVLVPVMIWMTRKLRLRFHDAPPQVYEILIPVLLWSFTFEVLLPSMPMFHGKAFADVNDIMCYVAGAYASMLIWNFYYSRNYVTDNSSKDALDKFAS